MKHLTPALLGFLAFTLLGTPAHGAEQLKNLKKCQPLANVKAIQDADAKENKAEADLNAAFPALKKFDATCKSYGTDNTQSQSQAMISQITSDGQDAQVKSHAARTSTQAAVEAMKKALGPVKALGGGECAEEIEGDIKALVSYLGKLDAESKNLGSCIKGGPVATSTQVNTNTSPAPGLGGAR